MSTLTNEIGLTPISFDYGYNGANEPAFSTTLLMDASLESVAFVGFVWHPTVKTGTINIRKVHFRAGAVTAAVGFRVSLQDVSATAGPPFQPDGVVDQFATMTPTANAWNTTGALSADRAVDLSVYGAGTANSRLLAVVFDYGTFTAGDSVVISSIATGITNQFSQIGSISMLNTAAWALNTTVAPILVLECDDGTFAFMSGAVPYSAISTATTANNAALRAIGVKFKVPTQRKVDFIGLGIRVPNVADGSLILYDSDGITALATIPIDNDAVRGASNQAYACGFIQPVTLLANTFYRLAIVPTTTTAITVPFVSVNAAAHMDGLILGQNAVYTTASDTPPTTWTDTTTQRPFFALGFSAFHDGGSGMLFRAQGVNN